MSTLDEIEDLVRIRTLLRTYADAGGRDPCLLVHAESGRAAIERLARTKGKSRGLPARVIPLGVEHIASRRRPEGTPEVIRSSSPGARLHDKGLRDSALVAAPLCALSFTGSR